MENDPSLLSIFLSWLPLLVVIGAWVYVGKKMLPNKNYYLNQSDDIKAQTKELKRIADALEKIEQRK